MVECGKDETKLYCSSLASEYCRFLRPCWLSLSVSLSLSLSLSVYLSFACCTTRFDGRCSEVELFSPVGVAEIQITPDYLRSAVRISVLPAIFIFVATKALDAIAPRILALKAPRWSSLPK